MSNETSSKLSEQAQTAAVPEQQKTEPAKKTKEKKPVNKKRRKKIKKIITYVIIILAVIALAAWKMGFFKSENKNAGMNDLSVYSVSTRTITKTLTSSGTIQPNDSYTITALVSGDITADYFDEGDTVVKDQLLYEIDSKNLDSSVKRAENSVKNAERSLKDAYENRDKLNVKAKNSGVIQKMYVEAGDEVSAGMTIADIIDKDTMCIDAPFMATDAANIKVGDTAELTVDSSYETVYGTVSEVSTTTGVSSLGVVTRTVKIKVKNSGGITPETTAFAKIGDAACTQNASFYYNDEGKIVAETSGDVSIIYKDEGERVSKDDVVIKLTSTSIDNQIESLELSLDDAKTSLSDSLDAYDNYNITSPIAGTVISKDYKAGDTLGSGGTNGGSSLAVIYDMSAFKFEMSIDELDIDDLSLGQDVVITSDARTGKEYHGTVTNISIQGSTTNGTTVYPVEVTIENTEDEDKRTTDEDGTVHKTYKTGKTSTVSQYKLSGTAIENGRTVYNYGSDIKITAATAEDGTRTYAAGEKNLTALSDGTYNAGDSYYSFSSDMGTLTLEVTDETQMLKPGMNIDADIVVKKVENVIAVPLAAVQRGNVVKVVKHSDGTVSQDNAADNSENAKPEFDNNANAPENMPEMPENAQMPQDGEKPEMPQNGAKTGKGNNKTAAAAKSVDEMTPGDYSTVASYTTYDEVPVKIGINDDDYVEITEGLEVGDVVILDEANAAGIGNSTAQQGQYGGFGGGPGGLGGGMGGGPGGSRGGF